MHANNETNCNFDIIRLLRMYKLSFYFNHIYFLSLAIKRRPCKPVMTRDSNGNSRYVIRSLYTIVYLADARLCPIYIGIMIARIDWSLYRWYTNNSSLVPDAFAFAMPSICALSTDIDRLTSTGTLWWHNSYITRYPARWNDVRRECGSFLLPTYIFLCLGNRFAIDIFFLLEFSKNSI